MSDASDIVDAISADVSAAVSGVTVLEMPKLPGQVPAEDFPLAIIVHSDPDNERLPWLQVNRTWTVGVSLWEKATRIDGDGLGTHETMQTKLEAIRDQVETDPTLGGACDDAICIPGRIESHPDSHRISGLCVVVAQKVA